MEGEFRLPERLFATDRFSKLGPMETMAVAVESVVEEAVDTTVEAVVVVEAMVEDVSMDTMVVVGGGGCRIFIHKTLNIDLIHKIFIHKTLIYVFTFSNVHTFTIHNVYVHI
ncbi:hypothetical protein Bca52824_072012 [Brassica carinata]|uniref:Uncharacterized protein n=1 Tax=Brassica carinata TaxID=52824 RepID=A0A8X7QB85_BRACI|nr:hypothetical protein Bca52824_072012 [Brassica carinata]